MSNCQKGPDRSKIAKLIGQQSDAIIAVGAHLFFFEPLFHQLSKPLLAGRFFTYVFGQPLLEGRIKIGSLGLCVWLLMP